MCREVGNAVTVALGWTACQMARCDFGSQARKASWRRGRSASA